VPTRRSVASRTPQRTSPVTAEATATTPAFAKSLVLGEIDEDLIFPFPVRRDAVEEERIRRLLAEFRDYAAEHIDSRAIDEQAWAEGARRRDRAHR
jgi:hypothetical protein